MNTEILSEKMQKRPPTELVMVRRAYDGLSCSSVMKFREVVPVPIFQEFKCFGTETLDGPLCLWRSVILAVEGNEESSKRNFIKYGTMESMTGRRDRDDPSLGPSTQPHFDIFPANRVLMQLGFYFLINSLKNLVFEVRLWIIWLGLDYC